MLLLISINVSAQTPVYNSYPSAQAVLLLDFDGHHMEGTSWNYNGPISVGPSNLNNQQVTEIFNRIAEDYRPFNINVTTDTTKYWSAPYNQRMRVVFTISSSWYGSAGGVAYTGSFKWGDNTPCFVFTALLNYNVKYISEAGAHEAGHTLGLRHQAAYDAGCNKTSEYNYGTGSGEIAWAPIMGVGYYRNFTVWHNGPSPDGCSSTQSDLDYITSPYNGFGYRNDDHSDNPSSCTGTTFTSNVFTASGVIERTTDRDMFRVELTRKGQFRLDAVPYNIGTGNAGSDLDMNVQLLSSSGVVLGVYDPGTALSSLVDTVLNPGTYYLLIDGGGNQYASEYGSLGSYSVQGTFMEIAPLPVRKLELHGRTDEGHHKLSWIIDADEAVVSQVLEVSSNGSEFRAVANMKKEDRAYNWKPASGGVLQYRMQVVFDNGRRVYSNVVTMKINAASKPVLEGNAVTGNLVINSPAPAAYSIYDTGGKLVSKGKISSGRTTLSVAHITSGIYVIRFDNGNDQNTGRFLKQ